MLRPIFSRRPAALRRRPVALLASALVIFGSWSIVEPSRCDGQGLLQRLEERIRGRIEQRLAPRGPQDRPPIGDAIRRGDRPSPVSPRARSARPAGDPTPRRRRAGAGDSQPSLGIEATQHRGRVPGLEVVEFAPRSLADEAGLRIGDVIVAIDGAATPTAAAAGRQLRQREIGEMVRLRVQRSSVLRNLSVPLVSSGASPAAERAANDRSPEAQTRREALAESRPGDSARPVSPQEPEPFDARPPGTNSDGWTERAANERSRRTDARPAGPEAATEQSPAADARLGAEWVDVEGEHGARVDSVAERSPAEVAGLRAGDRIVSVQGRLVTDAQTLTREVARHAPGDALVMQWVRGDDLVEAEVTLAGPDGVSPLAGQDASSGETAADAKPRSMLDDVGSALGNFFSGGGSAAAESPAEDQKASSEQPADANAESTDSAAETPDATQQSPGEGDSRSDEPSTGGTEESSAVELLPAPTGNDGEPILTDPSASQSDSPSASQGDSSDGDAAAEADPAAVQPASGGLQPLDQRDPPSLRQVAPPERTLPAISADRERNRSATEAGDQGTAPRPPQWRETVEQLQAEIERLEERIRQLENR